MRSQLEAAQKLLVQVLCADACWSGPGTSPPGKSIQAGSDVCLTNQDVHIGPTVYNDYPLGPNDAGMQPFVSTRCPGEPMGKSLCRDA